MTRAKHRPAPPATNPTQDALVAGIGSALVFLLISPFLNFIVMWLYSQSGVHLTLQWLLLHVSLPVSAVVFVVAYAVARRKSKEES